ESFDVTDGYRRKMNRQIRRVVVETKQLSDPQVTIDCVHIKRRNRDAMRVCNPRTLARSPPAMVRYIFKIVLGGHCRRPFYRSIETDAYARAADEREKSRTHLTMHVDHQVVFRTANLLEQIEEIEYRAPLATLFREIAPSEKNHVRKRRMAAHDFRVLGGDQPVNSGTRIARAQLYQHRDRVHDITQRRGLDQ